MNLSFCSDSWSCSTRRLSQNNVIRLGGGLVFFFGNFGMKVWCAFEKLKPYRRAWVLSKSSPLLISPEYILDIKTTVGTCVWILLVSFYTYITCICVHIFLSMLLFIKNINNGWFDILDILFTLLTLRGPSCLKDMENSIVFESLEITWIALYWLIFILFLTF